MKISDNVSKKEFLLQLRLLWVVFAIFLVLAFAYSKYFLDLIACSAFAAVAAYLYGRRQATFCIEVYDLGECLKLELDDQHLVIYIEDIDSVKIRDGREGVDWVILELGIESKFGRVIEFYPNMNAIPNARLDAWVSHFNERTKKVRLMKGRHDASPS